MKYNIGDIVPFEQTQEATDWVNSVEGNYYLEDYAPDEDGNMRLIVRQLRKHGDRPMGDLIRKNMGVKVDQLHITLPKVLRG